MSDNGLEPIVTVIMSGLNAAATLPAALNSLETQSYANWELVFCDDGSSDGTYRVAEQFSDRHPGRVILLRNPKNMKLAYSLNRCLERASGGLIARMDADDVCERDRFSTQVRYLQANPGVDLVGTAMRRFDKEGVYDVISFPERPSWRTMRNAVPFAHATIMARREVFDRLGGYTVSRRTERCEDHDLWFRFFEAGLYGENVPEALYLVREDRAAIRRRTPLSRFRAFRTTVIGYRRMGAPPWWYLRPCLRLLKVAVPVYLVQFYRRLEANKFYSHRPGNGRS